MNQEKRKAEGKAKASAKKAAKVNPKAKSVKQERTSAFEHLLQGANPDDIKEEAYDEEADPDYEDEGESDEDFQGSHEDDDDD